MTSQQTFDIHPVAAVRGKYIRTARDEEMRHHLERVLATGPDGCATSAPARFTACGETRGVLVIGEPGDGKTSLFHNTLKKHKALASDGDAPPRWVSLSVPSPATIKSLGLELLDRLGDRARRDDSSVVFDAEAGRRVAASVVRSVTLLSLQKHLGCSRPLVGQIVDERILSPLASGKERGGRTSKAFDAVDVAHLIDDLRMASSPVRAAGAGMVPVAKAAERAKIRAVDVLHLVRGGHLETASPRFASTPPK